MSHTPLAARDRYVILAAAFLGWMCSGVQMNLTRLAAGSATEEFAKSGRLSTEYTLSWRNLFALDVATTEAHGLQPVGFTPATLKQQKPKWAALYDSAFLLGAATGGLIFGWLGDRLGRVRAMGASILCYSLFGGVGYWVQSPEQLVALRFLSGLGVGGMWPTGVSLAAEAWSDVSRPLLSGLLGTSANVGIVFLSAIAYFVPLTPLSWRWVMLLGFPSAVLGLLVWALVPESPAWLAAKSQAPAASPKRGVLRSLFTPPLLSRTVLGIALGTIPLLGGWGVTAWLINWTEAELGAADFRSRAMTSLMRASGATIGSLCGGWIANLVGRRSTYFLISLFSFGLSEYIYLQMDPKMPGFSAAVFLVGMISTVFFGWLPLYLPELFPTHARATGSGISFNFGRYLTAAGVLCTGALTAYFQENYRIAGSVMSLIYAMGMVVILFAPDTTGKKLSET
jgi:SHS family sialic acid transporter-like MFS transporter